MKSVLVTIWYLNFQLPLQETAEAFFDLIFKSRNCHSWQFWRTMSAVLLSGEWLGAGLPSAV